MNLSRVIAVTVLLLAMTALAFASDTSLFNEANAKYRAGDFKAAAEFYKKIIDSGRGTAAVYYNLGNTNLRAGRKGAALVDYRRAQAVDPRDVDLAWNVGVLKSALSDRVDDLEDSWYAALFQKILGFFSLDEISLVFAGVLALLVALGALRYFFQSIRPVTGFLQTLALTALVLTGALFAARILVARDPRVVVLDKETEARYGPSAGETRAFTLHEGAEARVLDESGDWFYVTVNKNTGWLSKKSCEVI